jgi:transglutaminase-like putative cysteine protease
MSTSTAYVDRLERELIGAIGRRRRKRALVTGLAAMATVTAAVLVPLLVTGNGSAPALAIDIKDRLSDRPEEVAFVVSSPRPSYWRLTALADFDGTRWTSSRDRRDTSPTLLHDVEPGVDGETITQAFEITGLNTDWLPAAFSPVRVDGPDGITIDAETSSLFTTAETSGHLRYTVESVLPRRDAARLRAADTPPPDGLADRYLALPDDFPAELANQARAITAGAPTRYDQALALQNWFRAFTYDLAFLPGRGRTAMQDFVTQRRGYCEQFAGTYAAFARVLGLPSRVAVGFTQGERRNDGRYYVQDKHAHAWPEIYFAGVGWVPFEPTPGRGNPSAEEYTGVAAAQADGGGAPASTP